MRRSLEDLLLEDGLLDEAGLRHARRVARKGGLSLARAIVDEGQITDEALAEVVARKLRLPRADLARETVDDDAVREVPFDLADARRLLPLTIDRSGARRVIRVAMADPLDLDATEEIEMSTGCHLEPLVARAGELADAARRYYRGVITKMIPRAAGPITQPAHNIVDEAPLELKLEALVQLMIDRGQLDESAWHEAIRRLIKARAGE